MSFRLSTALVPVVLLGACVQVVPAPVATPAVTSPVPIAACQAEIERALLNPSAATIDYVPRADSLEATVRTPVADGGVVENQFICRVGPDGRITAQLLAG